MKVIYLGTPDFATRALEKIIEAGHEVTLVVTQPDRQKGRGKEVQFSPVKEAALKHNIPVFQPVKIKTPEAVEELHKYEADIFVVAAFGQILSKEILDMPKYGCVNIHASLLPKYRGAAPIQWAVINGDEKSGVTLMQMNEGLDTGDILLQSIVTLDKKETGESLFDKLAVMGAELIVEALPLIEQGKITPVKQKEEESCYARMLKKDMGDLDFNQDAKTLECLIRGLNSWPSAYTRWNGKTLKIWDAEVIEGASEEYQSFEKNSAKKIEPGMILEVNKTSFVLACKESALRIMSVQIEGKKRMDVKDFLLGYHLNTGDILG